MKNILMVLALLASLSLRAETINSMSEEQAKIDASYISQTVLLGQNEEKDIQVKAVVLYYGQSTDLSPMYQVLLTYFNGGEISNTRTSFDLGSYYRVNKMTRVRAGVYQIQVSQFEETELVEKTLEIDTTNTFIDDRELNIEEFTDVYFESSIEVISK